MWEHGVDVSKPELLAEVLGKRFDTQQVHDILEKAKAAEYKEALNRNTKEALDRGAFGCPWFWVRNAKGEEEPFFGSDRYVLSRSLVPSGKGIVADGNMGAHETNTSYEKSIPKACANR
jgi:2-hydroxychromene-2-carboxylate isomerase